MSNSTTIKTQQLTTATGATAAAAATALGDAIKALAITHPSWSVVEDIITGSSSWRWLVLKCTATGSQPNDFYVAFNMLGGSPAIVLAGESYNTGTHTLSTVACGGPSANNALDSAGRLSTVVTAAPSASGAVTTTGPGFVPAALNQVALNATTIYWWASFGDDNCMLAWSTVQANLDGNVAYFGGFESLVPTPATNDPVRVCAVRMYGISVGSANTSCSGTSREPLQVASTSRVYAGTVIEPAIGVSLGYTYEYGRAVSNGLDAYNSEAAAVSRVLLLSPSYLNSGAELTQRVSLRGRLNDTLYSPGAAAVSGVAPGDTFSYNGTLWIYLGTTSKALRNTGVAG